MPDIDPEVAPKRLLVAGAVLCTAENRFLLTERPQGKLYAGYWEFPGGKVHEGEQACDACARELLEELNITVDVARMTPWTFFEYAYPEYSVLMLLYKVWQWSGELCGMEGQAFAWFNAAEAVSVNLLPANKPLLKNLSQL